LQRSAALAALRLERGGGGVDGGWAVVGYGDCNGGYAVGCLVAELKK
jgi:hypothetical protein